MLKFMMDVDRLEAAVLASDMEDEHKISVLELTGQARSLCEAQLITEWPMTDEVHDEIISLMEDDYHTDDVFHRLTHPDYEHSRAWEGRAKHHDH